MQKIEKILLILIVVLTFIIIIPNLKLTGEAVINQYSYTKALCINFSYCEDYYIECKGREILKITPTGFSIIKQNANENLNVTLCDK